MMDEELTDNMIHTLQENTGTNNSMCVQNDVFRCGGGKRVIKGKRINEMLDKPWKKS